MTVRKLPLFDGFIETPFERRFQGLLRQAWHQRSWHVIVVEPGSGKTMGIGDLRDEAKRSAGMVGGRRYPVLAVTAPKNDPREAALGNLLLAALGVGARGRWSERKYLLYDLLGQYGVECLICDDAHDLSMAHLIFLKELTDHLFLAFPPHPLGLCLVTAGRGASIPLKDVFDQPETMWMQFRRRLDCLQPYCRVVSHTEGEVRDILIALEQIYRPSFPELNLQQWTGSVYTWLTHPLLDPQKSGRVLMDPLMKLVTTALKWSYAQAEADVNSKHLEAVAELLTLRRDRIQIIDAENNRPKKDEQEEQEPVEKQEKPTPRGRKAKEPKKRSSSDKPENLSPNFHPNIFWVKIRTRGVSGQYLRPNLHPIYQQRFGCPLLLPHPTGETCDHPQFLKGKSCQKDPNWEAGACALRWTVKVPCTRPSIDNAPVANASIVKPKNWASNVQKCAIASQSPISIP